MQGVLAALLFLLLALLSPAHGLFRIPPPPQAAPIDGLISTVAEAILRGRLQQADRVEVRVDSGSPIELISGTVRGVRVRGSNWCTPMRLSCRSLEVSVGRAAVDVPSLITKQAITLVQPAIGKATISFSAADWGSFLEHPLFIQAISAKLSASKTSLRREPPKFGSASVSFEEGVIRFPVLWDSIKLDVRLGQPLTSKAAVVTAVVIEQPIADSHAPNGVEEHPQIAASEATMWLTSFFNELELNLDGVRFRFARLTIDSQTLILDLRVVVNRFPSPMVNF
eukprot:scaffold241249_cov34-Tisochrysis_lutea.AAC.2